MENEPIMNEIQPIRPTLPSFGDLFNKTGRIYSQRFLTFMGILLPYAAPSLLYLLFKNEIDSFGKVPVLLFVVTTVIFSCWSIVSLFCAVKDRDLKIGVGESLSLGFKKIIPFWWVAFLLAIMTWGGLILLIVPGIIFSVWFSLSLPVFLSENLGGMKALFRSKQLVRGQGFNVWGKLFALGLFTGIIEKLGSSLVKSGMPGADYVDLAITVLVMPVSVIFVYLLYEDLKIFKSEVPSELQEEKNKIGYILLAVLGVVVIPAILLFSINSTRNKASEVYIETYMMQLRTAIEFSNKQDSQGYAGINCESKNVSVICDSINKKTGTNPVIFTSSDDYCAYVKMNKTEYDCVDSSLSRERGSVFPGGVGYCDGSTFKCPEGDSASSIY